MEDIAAASSAFVDEQVAIFKGELPLYVGLCASIEHALRYIAEELGLYEAIIQTRPKSIPSFAEKCIRKRQKYRHPAFQLTDLCGGRMIVLSRDVVPAVCTHIRQTFEIDEANSEDVGARLADTEFGYQSVHFVVSLREGGTYGPEVPPGLFKRRSPEQARANGLPIGPVYKAEIQVRTLLEHAWAAAVHDRMYKHDRTSTPHDIVRESGRIAAGLENADAALVGLTSRLDSFRSCYGAYMDSARMDEELGVLRATLPYDPENEQIAVKIANLELTRGRADAARKSLEPFAQSGSVAVHRVLGHACWRAGDQQAAERHLTQAVKLVPQDADALCELGDFYFANADTRHLADERFRSAYRAAPASVRALRSYLLVELTHGRVEMVEAGRSSVLQAIQTSQDLVAVGIHVPHGYFDIGVCHLLLGNPYDALTAIAKGSEASTSDEPLEELLKLLTVIQMQATGRQPMERHLRWARGLLRALLVARSHARYRIAIDASAQAEAALVAAEHSADLEALGKGRKKLAAAEADVTAAQEAQSRAHQELLDKPDRRTIAEGEGTFGSDLEYEGCPVFTGRRVVIVAGGCHPAVERQIAELGPIVKRAFHNYEGVVVSGGTRSGVAKLIGDLVSRPKLIKVAYLPARIPTAAPADRKYEKDPGHESGYDVFRCTTEDGYSPFENIQLWLDLLSAGVEPNDVRLVGINGGPHSAFEYRLALAMGAQVGVLRDSGREASKIATDLAWKSTKGLLMLPTDEETLAAFVQPPQSSGLLDDPTRERLAKQAHEQFLVDQKRNSTERDPRLVPWGQLIGSLKESNYAQIADIERKIERLGLKLRRKSSTTPQYEFTPEQIDELARMEHGRWVVERLANGWRLGSPKNTERRINPNLISWDALPNEEKAKDVGAVKSIPRQLHDQAGLEIYDPSSPELTG